MKKSIPALGIIGTTLFFFSMVGLSQAVTFPDKNKVHGAQHMAGKVQVGIPNANEFDRKNSRAKKSLRQGAPINKDNQRQLDRNIQRRNKPRGVGASIGKQGGSGPIPRRGGLTSKGGGVNPLSPPPPPPSGPIGRELPQK